MDAYEQRRSKMYDLVNESGFSKAIIGDPNSIAYFTGIGITPYERFYAMVLDAKNRTSSMIIPSVDTNCMKGTLPEIVYLDSEGPDKVIADAVEGCEAIAIEKGYFNIAVGEKFQKLGCEMFDVGEAIAKLICIGYAELTRQGQLIIGTTFRPFEIWFAVAFLYLIMTLSISRLVDYTEKRLDTNGNH
jgi:Xaa-Pro aminopeptidase